MQQDTNDRERQYRLDAATLGWTLAFRRWQADDTKPFPIIRPFAQGLPPEDAAQLMDYALSAIIDGFPEPMSADDDDEPETLELSPAGERALAAIRTQGEQGGYCHTCHCRRTPHDCTEPHAGIPGVCCVCGSALKQEGERA